jgi:hypothetical protein
LTVTDFSISFSVMNYNPSLVEFFGAAARLVNIGLGTTSGYVMGYDNGVDGIFISLVEGEQSQGPLNGTAYSLIPLVAGDNYQFTFTGYGNSFGGAIYNLGSSTPLATVSGTDSTYASGVVGLLAASETASGVADVTFGSFTVVPEPSALALLVVGGLALWAVRRRQAGS